MTASAPAAAPAAPPPLDSVASATSSLGSGLGDFIRWVASIEGQALVALGVAALLTLLLLAAKRWVGGALARGEIGDDSVRAIARDLVRRLMFFFILMLALRIGLTLVETPDAVDDATRLLFTVAAVLQGAIWAQAVAVHLLSRLVARHAGEASTIASAFVLMRWAIMVLVWSVALLLLLDNLGVNVTALVAGLGIGGVAIALAAQSTIANFFSAFSIITDRPFQQGDTIRFGDLTAAVEEIRIRTTRLRSFDGHEVVVPNAKLMEATIDNYNRMDERRAVLTIGVAYETPPALLRELPALIEACVERVESARFQRCHLVAFGPSSLDFELAFFGRSREIGVLMDARQQVLFNIVEAFAAKDVVIAYPTQTLHLVRDAADEPAGARG